MGFGSEVLQEQGIHNRAHKVNSQLRYFAIFRT
jgi:hypothetical protein